MPIDLNPLQQAVDTNQAAYTGALGARRNPLDLYNEAVSSLGGNEIRTNVGNLRKQILDTENLLNAVEGSVQGRTSGSLVTEAQRQRLTNQERAPIAGQYNKFSGDYANESQNLQSVLGQASQNANLGQANEAQKIEALLAALTGSQSKYDTSVAANTREDENKKWWDTFNANKAASDRAFAESTRQFNVSQANNKTNTTSNLLGNFQAELSNAVANAGNYIDLNGKKAPSTREDLIRSLSVKYGSIIPQADIAAAVYKNIRGDWEGQYNDKNFRNDVSSGAWKL